MLVAPQLICQHTVRALRPSYLQLSVDVLLSKADAMFPEGQGAVRAFARDSGAAENTNELLENATIAIAKLFKQRRYDPKKPEETNQGKARVRARPVRGGESSRAHGGDSRCARGGDWGVVRWHRRRRRVEFAGARA